MTPDELPVQDREAELDDRMRDHLDRQWIRDWQWSMTIAPPPLPLCLVTRCD